MSALHASCIPFILLSSFLSLSKLPSKPFFLNLPFLSPPPPSTMKLVTNFPKKIFNKYISCYVVSRSEPSLNSTTLSGSSSSSSSSSSSHGKSQNPNGLATPTTVLSPTLSNDISADKFTREELAELLRRLGAEPPSEEELNILLEEVDRDGDGCISLEEFGAIGSGFGPPACNSELRDAFDFFDTDRDGRITAEEVLNVFRVIGDARCTLEDCRRMISGVDKNRDGFVCFKDFCLMMEMQR